MAPKRKHAQGGSTGENGRQKQTGHNSSKENSSRRAQRENGSVNLPHSQSRSKSGVGYAVLVAAIACACGILHRNHIAGMFESDRHFSHLSTLERELAFRTEMGLYYSYYKTIIEAPSFTSGLHAIMYDNVTEYPQTINVLKRFNLYPEVFLGLFYRWYEGTMSLVGIPTKMCYKVNRGEGLTPVLSCEGLGEPSYFYIESVFLLNGINMMILFLFGSYLSGSIFGGILTVVCFFYNHGECTRVQWTPNLRESFSFPFFTAQMFGLTVTLKSPQPTAKHSAMLAVATVCFMLPWQFAQFALMTQTVAVFATYVLQYIGSHKIKVILIGQLGGLVASYLLLFGNEMLLTSFFASCLLTVLIIVMLEPLIEMLRIRILIWTVQGILLGVGTLGMKLLTAKLLRAADDAHIGDIFRSKFTNFANFHTMLYTCAAEFDFMEKETPWRVTKTLLAPSTVIVIVVVVFKLLHREYTDWHSSHEQHINNNANDHLEPPKENYYRKHRSKEHAEVVYHLIQFVAFTAMAVIIMRLKLFWTPHMCLITSLLASRKFFSMLGDGMRHYAVVVALLAVMSIGGYANLQQQWRIMGEFSNPPLEHLVDWINTKAPKDGVFAGPMPTMATVKLCTQRPIVNHPHYEDAGLRARTKKIYSMYSRKTAREVWQNYRDLQVDFAILEESWCVRRSRPGCGMAEIWDLEDEANRGKTPICAAILKNPEPYFTRLYDNRVYQVLRINPQPRPNLIR